jgi:hypothetical protein
MKFPAVLLFACLVAPASVFAELPQKPMLNKYAGLWNDSPFTTPPPPPERTPDSNPLDDYVLLGVSPIAGGYRVTLLNRKEPDKRIFVEPGDPDYSVLSVTRRTGDPLSTVVRMSAGTIEGNVTFDPNLLTVTPPPAAPQPQQQQQQQGGDRGPRGQRPPQNGQGQAAPSQTRQRVVAPQGGAPAAGGGRPQIQRPTTQGRGGERTPPQGRGGDRGGRRGGR